MTLDLRQRFGVGLVSDCLVQVKDSKDPVNCRHCLLKTPVNPAEAFDGIGKIDSISQEGNE